MGFEPTTFHTLVGYDDDDDDDDDDDYYYYKMLLLFYYIQNFSALEFGNF